MSLPNPDSEAFFKALRKKEFGRLDRTGQIYLDFTGGNLYPQSLVDKHADYLKENVFGNPHSINPTSSLSGKWVSRARKRVLDFFNTADYYCIFTQNASGALQIVGESYPFSPDSHLLLTVDNHNSVNGIREYCGRNGGTVTYSGIDKETLSINESELHKNLETDPGKKNKLFAFPAQSNVSGVRHSLEWIKKAQELGWDVLLDAAAFVPTSSLNLSIHQPDFVSLSFYKIFGYPTGIGCLLVKKSKLEKLKKNWFAGGTILLSAVKYKGHFLKQDHERFENGTVNYLNIPAITYGLDFIDSIGIDKINKRIKELSSIILSQISGLTHQNGQSLIKLYGPRQVENRGGTFMMNFLDPKGSYYSLKYVEHLSSRYNISLRTGCFCNPGVDELNHGIGKDQLKNYFESRSIGDYDEFISFLGKPRGAVRLSIGLATTISDIEKFISFAKSLLNKTIRKDQFLSCTIADFASESTI